ncbi:MAG TPA: hypothetical protein VGL89_15420 [Candidatus Koribacter sp.]|jgi:hypothetical protein
MLTVENVEEAVSLALHDQAPAQRDEREVFEVPLGKNGGGTLAATVWGTHTFEKEVWEHRTEIASEIEQLLDHRYPGTKVQATRKFLIGFPAISLDIKFPDEFKYEGPWTVFVPKDPTAEEIAEWTAKCDGN